LPSHSQLDGLVVVLVRPRNPLNIGAAARAMSNFGARELRLVNPYGVGFREARSAVGASGLLRDAQEFEGLAEAVADCSLVIGTTAVRNRALQHSVHRLNEAGSEVGAYLKTGRVALLFGSEKIGLTNDDFNHCHWLLTIPTQERNISMNLGQAVAVCLYELARDDSSEPIREDEEPATAGEVEKIISYLFEALWISQYVKPNTDEFFQKKIRHLMRRLNIQTTDAKVLLGMVRKIAWKLRQDNKR
jgi:tRNA/rRNA methyltransferase